MAAVEVEILKGTTERGGWVIDGPVQIGRQLRAGDPLLKLQESASGVRRLTIAGGDLTTMSRLHALVEPLDAGRARVTNQSERLLLSLPGTSEPPIIPGEHRDMDLDDRPVIQFGESDMLIRLGPPESALESLSDQKRPTGSVLLAPATVAAQPVDRVLIDQLLSWLDAALDLVQPATDEETYLMAARAVVDMLGLERGVVVLRQSGELECKAAWPAEKDLKKARFSRHVVNRALQYSKAFFGPPGLVSESTAGVALVAAAPIKDAAGQVIGALYGEGRKMLPTAATSEAARIKTALLQVLARAVSASLAQRELARLTQYLSARQVLDVLPSDEWERGQEMNVTVLFSDIRDFTSITSSITRTDQMVAWCRSVLSLLMHCVREHEGTLIDYTGDGLFALWGAPVWMRDHADRACQAALDMLHGLKQLDAEWAPKIHRSTEVRIGLNSGKVRVGNVGTREMPKFGAQGSVVNVGKRIETACKLFQCRAMMHHSTRDQVTLKAPLRRLGTICPVGVRLNDSFDVYELAPAGSVSLPEWRETYEEALGAFASGEAQAVSEAAWRLADWRKEHAEDMPALVLLRRIIDLALKPGKLPDEHPVWVLQEK